MSIDLGRIRRWSPADLEHIGDVLRSRSYTLLSLQDELDGASLQPPRWRGRGARVAAARRTEIIEDLRRMVAGVEAVRTAVWRAGDAVVSLHHAEKEINELASIYLFFVGDDNVIYDRASADLEENFAAEREMMRGELGDRIAQVITMAEALDADLAGVLNAAGNDEIDDGSGSALVTAQTAGIAAGAEHTVPMPPKDGSPAANDAYYDSLTEGQRAELLRAHPEVLGNLDGIPGAVRDVANRARLPDELATAEDQFAPVKAAYDRIQAIPRTDEFGYVLDQGTPEDRLLAKDYAAMKERVESLRAVRDTLDDDKQLLMLDLTDKQVKAAVADGNVDTADNVAVHVPGMTTTVANSLEGKDKEMRDLGHVMGKQLQRAGRGDETVATVTWIGYVPPDLDSLIDDSNINDTAATAGAAKAAAPALADFLNGIDASRVTDPHLTTLAHSYGSTTTGYALQEGTGVDNAVFYGSPGLSTDDVADLRVPDGKVFVAEAKRDLVADIGSFGGDPNRLGGVVNLSTSEGTTPDGQRLRESTGHSGYTKDETTSQYNFALVAAGLSDRVIEDDNVGFGDYIRDAIIGPAEPRAR